MEQTILGNGLNRQELLRRLKDSQLLSAADLERAAAANPDADAPALANALVVAGLLTTYQIQAVTHQKTGELRIGNYDILDRLGAGGMGTVFRARHRRMKRVVALKVLAANLGLDETFVQRFQREVETIARLSHPNIVMAYDADEGELGHFLVMEFVNGQDLASIVQKQGPFEVTAAVDAILQAARGLAYAHSQQIIHRDIKPANLLRDVSGLVKVTDLGLARLTNAGSFAPGGSNALTQAGGILGTVDYMPPEQAVDTTTIDHRADIYSLGATLHFLLLGRPPYSGSTMMATLLKHREAPIPSLVAVRTDVPAGLDAIFRRMLAKTPAERYQTMTEVVHALEVLQAVFGNTGSQPGFTVLPSASVPTSRPDVQHTMIAPGSAAPQTMAMASPNTALEFTETVVLVEPSRTQAGIIRKYLQGQHVEKIVTASTGKEALELARAHHPRVLISAMHLPDMTGLQLAKQIREQSLGAVPGFLLISSEDEGKEAGTHSKIGLATLLHKPFTPEQLVQALKLATPPLSTAPARARGQLRVLIVDDSGSARMHERSVLQGLGFVQFVEAADGAQAVAVVAREKFDLIISDYNMPYMDGGSLTGYLKQNPQTAAVPIIMVTTETDPSKIEAVRRLGVTAICEKSFPVDVVRGLIDRLFGQ
jgi:serine/threonine protein kinase/DNA-binding response OmpR family regulator